MAGLAVILGMGWDVMYGQMKLVFSLLLLKLKLLLWELVRIVFKRSLRVLTYKCGPDNDGIKIQQKCFFFFFFLPMDF